MSRYHLIPWFIPRGVCYQLRTVIDSKIHYFKDETAALIQACRRSFGQFSSGELNRLVGREWWRIIRPLFRYEFKNRIFPMERMKNSVVLSAEELAILLRLPSGKVNSTKLDRMKMRRTPLPLEVKRLNDKKEGIQIPIGLHEYHGQATLVKLDLAGLNRHMAIWGGTMMGKSTFIYNFLEDLMKIRTEENKI
ncbi:hypothetical protein [Ammoniphilus sp. 3BR4]|uniref:hypothetical protein n=1 Tax=Ammoniphilus sp. 3BR4 TaxID=3158265 RepID=UPI0034651042